MKAALLSAPAASGKGVYLRMVDVAPDEITDRHVPSITECDLPRGRYVWIPGGDPRNTYPPNEYGGTFVAREVLALGIPLHRQGDILGGADANMRRLFTEGM
jgi:hypothetical protein